jgi:outer membrane protein assembly factor BamB
VRSETEAEQTVSELWRSEKSLKTKMSNVVVYKDHIYGLSGGILECVRIEGLTRAWKRGRYGHGQVMLVGDLLLVLSEKGELALVRASPEKFDEVTTFQVLDDKTWNNPALAGDYLLVRNHLEAACYQLPLENNDQASE